MNEVDNRSHMKNVLVVDVPIYYISISITYISISTTYKGTNLAGK
jgi:hypothetical protein